MKTRPNLKPNSFSPDRDAKWHEEMVEFSKRTGGVAEVILIRKDDLLALFASAASGNAESEALCKALMRYLKQTVSFSYDPHPGLCFTCDHEFRTTLPRTFLVSRPYAGDQSLVVVSGLCEKCAQLDDRSIHANTLNRYRESLWPDAYEIQHPKDKMRQ